MTVCPFDSLSWECPKPGDGRKNKGHLWRVRLRGEPKGPPTCAICGKARGGKRLSY